MKLPCAPAFSLLRSTDPQVNHWSPATSAGHCEVIGSSFGIAPALVGSSGHPARPASQFRTSSRKSGRTWPRCQSLSFERSTARSGRSPEGPLTDTTPTSACPAGRAVGGTIGKVSKGRRRVVLPLSEWRELGAPRRREVRRAARRGDRHPDPYVAAVAYAWAAEVTRVDARRPSGRERIADLGIGAAILAVIGVLVGPIATGGFLGGGSGRPERRLVGRILALGPPEN
jgi:hypothetical protein